MVELTEGQFRAMRLIAKVAYLPGVLFFVLPDFRGRAIGDGLAHNHLLHVIMKTYGRNKVGAEIFNRHMVKGVGKGIPPVVGDKRTVQRVSKLLQKEGFYFRKTPKKGESVQLFPNPQKLYELIMQAAGNMNCRLPVERKALELIEELKTLSEEIEQLTDLVRELSSSEKGQEPVCEEERAKKFCLHRSQFANSK